MAAKKTTSNSVAGKLYNAAVEAGTTELTFNEFKIAYLAAQEQEAAVALSGANGILGAVEVLEVVEGAIAVVDAALAIVVAVKEISKAELSRAIFTEELAKQVETGVEMVRQTVLNRFIAEAGCTKAGANTYFHNCRKANGLVGVVKVAKVVAEPIAETVAQTVAVDPGVVEPVAV